MTCENTAHRTSNNSGIRLQLHEDPAVRSVMLPIGTDSLIAEYIARYEAFEQELRSDPYIYGRVHRNLYLASIHAELAAMEQELNARHRQRVSPPATPG